jgi:hypothetical protein
LTHIPDISTFNCDGIKQPTKKPVATSQMKLLIDSLVDYIDQKFAKLEKQTEKKQTKEFIRETLDNIDKNKKLCVIIYHIIVNIIQNGILMVMILYLVVLIYM